MFTCRMGMRLHFLTFTPARQWEKQCPLRTETEREGFHLCCVLVGHTREQLVSDTYPGP